ncbi:hypothetical protein ABW21_db0206543 [Orbilia brochopaga]|nr:hypothetical protein ABW21_db0206543 [Drechslerella brochopaga]
MTNLNYTGIHVKPQALLNRQEVDRLKHSAWNTMLQPRFLDRLSITSETVSPSIDPTSEEEEDKQNDKKFWADFEHSVNEALAKDTHKVLQIIHGKMPRRIANGNSITLGDDHNSD